MRRPYAMIEVLAVCALLGGLLSTALMLYHRHHQLCRQMEEAMYWHNQTRALAPRWRAWVAHLTPETVTAGTTQARFRVAGLTLNSPAGSHHWPLSRRVAATAHFEAGNDPEAPALAVLTVSFHGHPKRGPERLRVVAIVPPAYRDQATRWLGHWPEATPDRLRDGDDFGLPPSHPVEPLLEKVFP